MKQINIEKIDWQKVQGLVPAIIQDAKTDLVLMLGYMDSVALAKTIETGYVWFYSRTRKRLWMKGETSGNTMKLQEIKIDCDYDTLLIKVVPAGFVCHNGTRTCFAEEAKVDAIRDLLSVIVDRKEKMPTGSYTTKLFQSGLDKICLKVAEESLEVVQAAQKQTRTRLIEESTDLIYHLFVLLAEKEIGIEEIEEEINKRRK